MLNLVLFEVSFASRTSKESNESHVRPAKCKTDAPKQWMLRKSKMVPDLWSLVSEIWPTSIFFVFKAGLFTIIYHQNKDDLHCDVGVFQNDGSQKMSTLGFRDPFVAIPLGKRSIFGTYASTARVTVEPLRGTSFQNAH